MPSNPSPCSRARTSERKVRSPLASNDEVHPAAWVGIGVGGEARIVAAHGAADPRAERVNQLDDPERRLPLKRHHGESDEVGLPFADKPLDGGPESRLTSLIRSSLASRSFKRNSAIRLRVRPPNNCR